MKNKKLLASFLSAAMVITAAASGMGTTVLAYEPDGASENEIQVEFVEDINSIEVKSFSDIQLNAEDNNAEGLLKTTKDLDAIKAALDNGEAHEIPAPLSNIPMESYYSTITEEKGIKYVIVPVGPGDIVNATLLCPLSPQLDYDLMLYEYDVNTERFGSLLEYSMLYTKFNTYPDNTQKTADESISYINTSNQYVYYAVVVYAAVGYSSMYNFGLQISVTERGQYDTYEANDSPYYPTILSTTTATGLSLHAENDHDWFGFVATSSLPTITISTGVPGYTAELYTSDDGVAMYLETPDSSGSYILSEGKTYYIHVYSTMANFVAGYYTLKIQPGALQAGKIYISAFDGDMGSDRATYAYGALYRFKRDFQVTVLVTTSDGYALGNQEVTLLWESGAWSIGSGNHDATAKKSTDSNGRAVISLSTPVSAGSKSYILSGAITFIHYYDLDKITVSIGKASASMNVYHFANSSVITS